MVRVVVANAFSLSMVKHPEILLVTRVPFDVAKELLKKYSYISIIGHESTAQLLTNLLDANITVNRIQYTLEPNDVLLVFQLLIRLQEGKVLSKEELEALLREGKAMFYLVGPATAFWETRSFAGPEAWFFETEFAQFLMSKGVFVPKP